MPCAADSYNREGKPEISADVSRETAAVEPPEGQGEPDAEEMQDIPEDGERAGYFTAAEIATDLTQCEDGGQSVKPKVAKLFAQYMETHLSRVRCCGIEVFAALASECQSEIERLMLAALLFMETGYSIPPFFPAHVNETDLDIRILPQHPVDRFRLDFAVHVKPIAPGPMIKVAVECDGHYYHDRTKEQATRDKLRDRILAENGYTVLRFTESEIQRDAKACADQVEKVIGARNDELIALVMAAPAA